MFFYCLKGQKYLKINKPLLPFCSILYRLRKFVKKRLTFYYDALMQCNRIASRYSYKLLAYIGGVTSYLIKFFVFGV